jgi:short-subunit dehydrogenase/ubiquinone/menaquinone biosynthesis C-methylase UbiE
MNRQNKAQKQNQFARLGITGLAVGLFFAGMRARRKAQARRWQAHLNRPVIRRALVTGASAGIGQAYAARLASEGYQLVLVARRTERLEALAAKHETTYAIPVEVLPADLSTEAGIAKVEQRLAAGDIDFLVNNAGYDVFGNFAQIPIEKVLGLIQCLELATVRLTRAALPGMLERRRGAVINLSSIGAFGPKRKDTIYVASKTFINRFSESLALELKGSGVRIQSLCPGFTLTEFHDAPEYAPYHIKARIPAWLWMKPEQVVAESLQALAEDRVIYVPGGLNKRVLASFFPHSQTEMPAQEARLDLLACPDCHGSLTLQGSQQDGKLTCANCAKAFPITNGIPRFAGYASLTGLNRRFAGLYDWFSIFYRLFSKVAFGFIGTTEDEARFEILDPLEPCGKVLEVSVGPGVNLPYLREYPSVREIHGLDLSNGQLAQCQRFARRNNWPVSLYQGNAEALPFQENAFDSVFHIGGINFFNDKKKAISEMIRVARPGATIVICDETERGARGYDLTLPGFKQSFKDKRDPVRPPVDLVPAEMEAITLDETAWKGWFYLLKFRKPIRSH